MVLSRVYRAIVDFLRSFFFFPSAYINEVSSRKERVYHHLLLLTTITTTTTPLHFLSFTFFLTCNRYKRDFFVSNRHSHQPLLQGVPAQGKLATFIYGIHLTHCLSAISTSAIHADFSFFPRAHLPLLILDSEHPKSLI